jgi:hypothetical protein
LFGRGPRPNEELIEALDAVAAAIEGLQSAQPEQKELAKKALGELKHFARGLPPGAAIEFGRALGSNLFGGS